MYSNIIHHLSMRDRYQITCIYLLLWIVLQKAITRCPVFIFMWCLYFSSEFTYMSLVITICCLHMRQLMVDMYQSNHCEFSFSNKSDLLVHLYTHSDDGTSIHILLYSFHIKVSSGRRFRTYNEKNPNKCRYWRRVLH